MSKIRRVEQMELDQFGATLQSLDESGTGQALSVQEIRTRELAARQALGEKIEGTQPPSWSDCYHRLINAGWPWRVAAYVAWASMPKSQRWPSTQEELAIRVLGLNSDRQIATWRKKNPGIDQMIADLQADELLEARADVFGALKESASTPDYKHAPDRRMYLELTGDLVTRLSVTTPQSAARTLLDKSDADLLSEGGEEAIALLRKLREELREAQDAEE